MHIELFGPKYLINNHRVLGGGGGGGVWPSDAMKKITETLESL